MRLLRVELTRFRSRRAIVLIVLAAALLTTLITATTLWDTRPVSPADRAAAEAMAEREAADPMFQRDFRQCQQSPQDFLGPGATAEECDQILPQAEWYLDRGVLDLAAQNESAAVAVTVLLTAFLVVVGTTFAGADWASGSVSNQLLFESRRSRVWLAKAGAVMLGATLAAVVLLGGFWLALFLAADTRGISTPDAATADIVWTSVRAVALVAVAAAAAYALTMLLRHTVGTLATMFAYAVGGEILLFSLPIEGIGRWSLSNNVFGWLFDGYEYYDPTLSCPPGEEFCEQVSRVTLEQGAWFLGVLALLVAVLSLLSFRRRDVP